MKVILVYSRGWASAPRQQEGETMDQKASAKVLVLDFGAQYGQLIARRVRDLNVYSEIVPCDISADEIREMNASALILSGGPASVYAEDAPSIDPAIFDLGLPVLGFCYGHQITAVTLGGKVGHSEVGEYGRATITRTAGAKLFNSTPMQQTVWMSHRDAVSEVPEGFTVTASTDVCPVAAMECPERKIFTTQFHPEVKHSEYGQQLLSNFLFEICGLEPNWSMDNLVETMTAEFREKVGDDRVILALSGGVDSSVVAALGARAVGKQMTRDARYFGLATRICAENGASIVKTYYCEGFEKVAAACPVPVVIAGGKKLPEQEALTLCYNAINDGAAGVDMGRNVFQSEHPAAMIQAVHAVVHDNLTPEQAFEMYQDLSK